MWYFNSALDRFFDLMLTPFESLHPFWLLLIFSLIMGIIMIVIFRYTSNQKGIKETKEQIKAHLLEIRLFKDDLRVLFSAQRRFLLYNLKYMKHALKPMLFMIVPVSIVLIQLAGWFEYRPLKPGESAVVSIKLADSDMDAFSNIAIQSNGGLTVETPPLRIPDEREVDWRIRADEIGDHNLTFSILGYTFQKRVIVSNGRIVRVSPRVVALSFWDTLLNPGEEPIAKNSLVKRIEVNYPSRSIEIFGWRIHWLLAFFVLSIVFGYAFRGFFRVEI